MTEEKYGKKTNIFYEDLL